MSKSDREYGTQKKQFIQHKKNGMSKSDRENGTQNQIENMVSQKKKFGKCLLGLTL